MPRRRKNKITIVNGPRKRNPLSDGRLVTLGKGDIQREAISAIRNSFAQLPPPPAAPVFRHTVGSCVPRSPSTFFIAPPLKVIEEQTTRPYIYMTDSPLDFQVSDIPLPCCYLTLPWRPGRSWTRLTPAKAPPMSANTTNFASAVVRDIVSRMVVERMTVHPSVYIIRYTHWHEQFVASVLPELLLTGQHRGDMPLKNREAADKLIELSRIIYSGTHTLGLGFSQPFQVPYIKHFVSNGGHRVTQVYTKYRIHEVPKTWNELCRVWQPIKDKLKAMRWSSQSGFSAGESYNERYIENPLVDPVRIAEGRLGHLVVVFDIRFDEAGNASPWDPAWMRHWLFLCGLVHAMISAWLAVDVSGRSLQVLILPPEPFSVTVDRGIRKQEISAKSNNQMLLARHEPHPELITASPQVERINGLRSAALGRDVNGVPGVPAFLGGSVHVDVEHKKKNGFFSSCFGVPPDVTEPPSLQLAVEPHRIAEYPYDGVNDERLSTKSIPYNRIWNELGGDSSLVQFREAAIRAGLTGNKEVAIQRQLQTFGSTGSAARLRQTPSLQNYDFLDRGREDSGSFVRLTGCNLAAHNATPDGVLGEERGLLLSHEERDVLQQARDIIRRKQCERQVIASQPSESEISVAIDALNGRIRDQELLLREAMEHIASIQGGRG